MTAIPAHYVITCPDCHGRLHAGGILCPTCEGAGRLLIPERTPRSIGYRPIRIRALRVMFLVALVLGVIVALAVNR